VYARNVSREFLTHTVPQTLSPAWLGGCSPWPPRTFPRIVVGAKGILLVSLDRHPASDDRSVQLSDAGHLGLHIPFELRTGSSNEDRRQGRANGLLVECECNRGTCAGQVGDATREVDVEDLAGLCDRDG
jgi:hypothetical protein